MSVTTAGEPAVSNGSENGSSGLKQHSWPKRRYCFSSDWFEWNHERWGALFDAEGLRGKPGLHYLEVGTFEGASLIWMLENVLTHPTSRAVAVDLLLPRYRDRLFENLTLSGQAQRVRVVQGASESVLRPMPRHAFDIIFIDGGHHSAEIFFDLALC